MVKKRFTEVLNDTEPAVLHQALRCPLLLKVTKPRGS